MKRLLFLTVLLATGLCAGCRDAADDVGAGDVGAADATASDVGATDRQAHNAATAPPTKDAAASTDPAVNSEQTPDPVGSFNATVLFDGTVPPPQQLQATKDQEFCSLGSGFVQDVQVTEGRLAGAVVEFRVRDADPEKFVTPEGGFVLRQKDCLFTPRLLVAFDGAELTVHNDDKVQHNVNTGSWNLLQSPDGEPIREKIAYQGTPFARVTCNIHSWMESWVYVARSPYYGVSDENGQVNITDIPVGHYRGTITHATLGKQTFKVDIYDNGHTHITFRFPDK